MRLGGCCRGWALAAGLADAGRVRGGGGSGRVATSLAELIIGGSLVSVDMSGNREGGEAGESGQVGGDTGEAA